MLRNSILHRLIMNSDLLQVITHKQIIATGKVTIKQYIQPYTEKYKPASRYCKFNAFS